MAFYMGKSPLSPSATSYALRVSLALLIINSILAISLVSTSIVWLNSLRHKVFYFFADGSRHHLSGLPHFFVIDQLYTVNGAAATSLTIGIWGIVSLWLRNLTQYRTGDFAKFSRYCYYLWVSFNVPALLLTNVSLIYIFAITNAQAGQKIDTELAVELNGSPYFEGTWTPQSWLSAVLGLKLVRDREDIENQLKLMEAWRYNLIPMFVIHLTETALVFMDYNRWLRKPKLPEAYAGF
ncbi:hypothetical protein GGR58DRAFT_522627 [Xylaria digitata]|nr:hypothetical protein GGR58DRAFT_522627 [Xylaria digitata]